MVLMCDLSGKRPGGKPRRRWMDNIKRNTSVKGYLG